MLKLKSVVVIIIANKQVNVTTKIKKNVFLLFQRVHGVGMTCQSKRPVTGYTCVRQYKL